MMRSWGARGGHHVQVEDIHKISEKVDSVFKVVVIGDSAVGKSQMLSRFSKNEFCFDSNYNLS